MAEGEWLLGVCDWIHIIWEQVVIDPRACRDQKLGSWLGLPQKSIHIPESQLIITGAAERLRLTVRIMKPRQDSEPLGS